MIDKKKICSFALALLMLGCASTPDYWYKSGKNQHDFDRDSKDCEIVALQLSKEKSEKGKQIEFSSYASFYSQCIVAKGWSRDQPFSSTSSKSHQPETGNLNIQKTDQSLTGFRQTITMPKDFSLHEQKQIYIGPTFMEQFIWQNKSGVFITIIFQENTGTYFETEEYPVLPPFYLYDSERGNKRNEKLRWASFFGTIENEWVMGVGAYYYTSKTKRIITVITGPLSSPFSPPPDSLQLSKNQYQEIETFSEKWQPWLEEQFVKN